MKDSIKNEALANMFAPYTSELLCNSHLILHVGLPVLALRCQGRVAPKLSLNKGMEALQKICKPSPKFTASPTCVPSLDAAKAALEQVTVY